MTWKWSLCLLLVVPATFAAHEGAHWLAGELLGYDMEAGLNHARPATEAFRSARDENIVSAAGPTVTIVQAFVALGLVLAFRSRLAFACLFAAFTMRLLAFGVSVFNLNDEARISVFFGWPWHVLPAVVVASLFMATLAGAHVLQLGWRSWSANAVVASIAIAAIVLGEPYLPTLS